jgi:hypothetical protein
MNECDNLVIQFFLRAISGAVALVLGTGLCYFLFIGRYLRQVELYKERLRIYKDLDRHAARLISSANSLSRSPSSSWTIDSFSTDLSEFNENVVGEDRLFMTLEVQTQCHNIVTSQEDLSPPVYPPDALPYEGKAVRNLENEFRNLRGLIEREIASAHSGIPTKLNNWLSRVKAKIP